MVAILLRGWTVRILGLRQPRFDLICDEILDIVELRLKRGLSKQSSLLKKAQAAIIYGTLEQRIECNEQRAPNQNSNLHLIVVLDAVTKLLKLSKTNSLSHDFRLQFQSILDHTLSFQ
eukprot:3730114-Amphidinium_carterae.1